MKKYLWIALICLASMPLFAQECYQTLNGGEIIGVSCIPAVSDGDSLPMFYTYTFLGDTSDFKNYEWSYSGDIEKIYSNKGEIMIKSTGNARGYISLSFTRYRDSARECLKTNCVGYSYYSSFSIGKIYDVDIQLLIEGSRVIKQGQKYLFSVSELSGYGLSGVNWIYPADLFEQTKASSGMEYITFLAKRDAKTGDSLGVTMGRNCNPSVQTKIALLSEIRPPELASLDSIQCLSETQDSIFVSVKNPDPSLVYWWEPLNPKWGIRPLDEHKHQVMMITHGEAGSFLLYASQSVDTVSSRFEVTRQLQGEYTIMGDTACLQRGSSLKIYLYPAPLDKISWTLPLGWEPDKDNPTSSTTYPALSQEAVSGWVSVATKACGQILDSIYVYIQSPYDTSAGIDISLANCVAEGDTAYFRIPTDPNVQSYIWEFAQDWQPSQIEINNPCDTIVKVVVGKEQGFAKVRGITCNGEWNMQVENIKKGPRKPNLIPYTGCVNLGMRDTITLQAEPDSNSIDLSYIWSLPETWTPIGCTTCDSIEVVTQEESKIQRVYSVKTDNGCISTSEAALDSIMVKGTDTTIVINKLTIMSYIAKFPPNQNVMAGNYLFLWHKDSIGIPVGDAVSIPQNKIKPSIPVLQYKRKDSECWSVTKGVYVAPAPQLAPANMESKQGKSSTEAILIQPNPTTSSVEVKLNESYESLSVFNMEGLRLKSFNISGKSSLRVDLSDYKAGTYLFRFTSDIGDLRTEKIVKL